MTRIGELFKRKKANILNVYCTAGFPQLDSLSTVMHALQDNGADMIEVGMPYSDPIADGAVIQQSNAVALHNGITITEIFRRSVLLPALMKDQKIIQNNVKHLVKRSCITRSSSLSWLTWPQE